MTDHIAAQTTITRDRITPDTIAAAVTRARAHFAGDYCCAESVLLALLEHFGSDPAPVMPVASGFCGGIAGSRGVCGAVSGAVMALGVILADTSPPTNRAVIEDHARRFMDAFRARFEDTGCGALLHIQAAEGLRQFSGCPDYVGEAVRLVLELLAEF